MENVRKQHDRRKKEQFSIISIGSVQVQGQPCPDCTGRKPVNMSQKQITVCPAKTSVWTARGSGTQNMLQQATATQVKHSQGDQLLQKA